MTGSSTIPINILVTSQRPDLVIANECKKLITILELSIPFELNIESTHELKVNRYSDLVADLEMLGYTVSYYPFEIGSRGYISPENVSRFKHFMKSHNIPDKYSLIRDTFCKIALLGSYIIYNSKVDKDWVEPSLIKI